MIKNQQAYDQALEEIVDNNDDIKALKNIVDQIASELLDGDPNDTLSLLEFCVEEAPYAAWALINSPVAFKPLLNTMYVKRDLDKKSKKTCSLMKNK